MTRLVYPRLLYAPAMRRIEDIARSYETGGTTAVEAEVACSHPRAEPVATGGHVADATHIERVREAVCEAVAPWRTGAALARHDVAAFDLALGRALHDSLQIVPGDAAHEGTWNFLTLVVFPDLAVLRFPAMHEDRMLGRERNVLRRTWIRRDTLGDLTDNHPQPLGEDEMVGLFERSEMARNRPLVRAAAAAVMAYKGHDARSEWARQLYKRIRYATGPRSLDGFTEEEITAFIHGTERDPDAG